MAKLNVAIIGVGRFGFNYLKTLNEIKDSSVSWICAAKKQTLDEAVSKINPKSAVKKTTSYNEILKDKNVDAVIIATPGSTHYKIARDSLLADKHVLVEKPICLISKDVENLIKISNKKNKILMAGHLQLFNPGIQKLKEDIKSGLFGKIHYISTLHSGNGPIREDMNALWDFFPHSISIIIYLLEKEPIEISADGASFLKNISEDMAVMEMKFPGNTLAISTGTWIYPLKKFEIVIAGENLYAVFDDYAKEDKLKYYDSTPKIINRKIIIEDKGCRPIQISNAKPLTEQINYFLNCIKKNKISINDGKSALKVTRILEAAEKSMRSGKKIKVNKL